MIGIDWDNSYEEWEKDYITTASLFDMSNKNYLR
jgi:hypothetical protein